MAKRYQLVLTASELLMLDDLVRESIERERLLSGHVFQWYGPEAATRHLSAIDGRRRILAAVSSAVSTHGAYNHADEKEACTAHRG